MSEYCKHCAETDEKLQAAEKRIKELEESLQILCENEIAVMKSRTAERERRLARLKDGLPANLPKMSLWEAQRQLTEKNSPQPPADPTEDGNYLFREEPDIWWRAATIKKNSMYANWIANGFKNSISKGEWHGPLADDNPEWVEANQDSMGRLLRKFEPSPADHWLGVWRAKKDIEIHERTCTIHLSENTQINVCEKNGDVILLQSLGGTRCWCHIAWLQENFEKVTEEG